MNSGRTWYSGAVLYGPDGPIPRGGILVNARGVIEACGADEAEEAETAADRIEFEEALIVPGFIDVHVHGGGGYQMMDATYESLDGMSRFHASHGTTSFLATTGTDSEGRISAALRNAAASRMRGLSGAELLGVHLEGPYLDLLRSGAQDKTHIRPFDLEELKRFMTDAGGGIRLVTLAPERPGGMLAVRWLAERGVAVSIGHSNADFEEALLAVHYGARHTTHHFNGMSPLHHRQPGLAGAGLAIPELTLELIADGIHVHPAVLKLAFDLKTAAGICMVTDAVYCAGLPDGVYGHKTMKDGKVYLSDGSSLAGSSLTMDRALQNMARYTGYPLERLLPSFAEVPARQIGLSARKGSLAPGKDADFVVLNAKLEVAATFVKGKKVYGAG